MAKNNNCVKHAKKIRDATHLVYQGEFSEITVSNHFIFYKLMVAHTGFRKPTVLPNKHLSHCLCTFLDIKTVINQHYKNSFSLRIKFLQPIFLSIKPTKLNLYNS